MNIELLTIYTLSADGSSYARFLVDGAPVDLLQMASHTSKNTSHHHLESFYKTFDEISEDRYDGMIITGAPVELLDYS